MPSAPTTPTPKVGRNRKLGLRATLPRPPGYLPPEIAAQPVIAHQAFSLLLAKPTRSLRSIAREIDCPPASLRRYAHAGRWEYHLAQILGQSAEAVTFAARQEALRSRSEMLGSNRLAEGAIEAALSDLVVVDEHGNVRLKPGADVADVEKLARARQTHVKTTQLLTGEAAATQRAVAAAGAPRIVFGRNLEPEILPATGQVVSSPASAGE